jgi:hypothetical protein
MISKNHNRIRANKEKEDSEGEDILELKSEKKVSFIISAVFMVLVGLSMPLLEGVSGDDTKAGTVDKEIVDSYLRGGDDASEINLAGRQSIDWGLILFHVLIVTILSNIGKIVPAFVYRNEAGWRERLAVAIAMFPRGEVGAGVLIISLSYGIGGMIVTISMLSLALNLLLTGLFILMVKALLNKSLKTQV